MKFALTAFLGAVCTLLAQQPQRARFATGYLYSYYVPQAASTPWRPAWSPDGKSIAFAMSGSIWQIGVGDTVAYELTANRTYDSSPAWSPDGRWIAYTSEDSQGVSLMLLNVATRESTVLAKGGIHADPVFAPSGNRLAFVKGEATGTYHIYVMPFDNGRTSVPTQITAANSFGRPRLYFGANDDHISPSWSPDGRELLLVSNRGIPLGSGAIWRAPADPDAMGKARMILREETLYRTQPQWSPDGKRLIYSSHRGSQYNNLYVLPVMGGEPYQMTFGDWDHFDPRWSPDGEWIAYISNQHGLSELRLLRTFGGEQRKVEIRRRIYRRPMGTLEVAINGAARFYLTAADGKTYTPPSSFQRVAGRFTHRDFFQAEERFTVELPPGEATLEVARGIEFAPETHRVTIGAGRLTTLKVDLKRAVNMKAQGWWSGSDHVHMNYGGNLHNTPENLMFMARAEDLNVVGAKVANKDHRIFDHQFFTGQLDGLSNAGHILKFDQEYRPPFYGHINCINLTRHLISPFTTGYEGSAIESLYPSNTDMFRLARTQGASCGYVHPWAQVPEKNTYSVARGFPVDLALGSFDYLEVLTGAEMFTNTAAVWHRALNCGFKVTASAGEDSILSLHATPIVGSARLYAYLGEKLDWAHWVDAVRQGRTFVTNGPLLRLEIDGRMPGDEIRLPAEGGTIEVAGSVDSIVPLEKLELFFNGKAIETVALAGGQRGEFRKRIRVDRSGWFTLRASHSRPQHPIDDSYVVGETSPIYVYKGTQAIRSTADATYFVRWIDDITRQAQQHPGWRSDAERKHVLGQFAEARRIMEQRAAEGNPE
jgi:TolB protein